VSDYSVTTPTVIGQLYHSVGPNHNQPVKLNMPYDKSKVYMTGGAGVVLNRAAVTAIRAAIDASACPFKSPRGYQNARLVFCSSSHLLDCCRTYRVALSLT
jgi:hypothetical protein